jgi:predicted RecB family nuclease
MRLISASMLRDLLLCERKLALDLVGHQDRREPTSPFVQMLWRDGLAHEGEVLAGIPGSITDLRGLAREDREIGTSIAISSRAPVILGSVLRYDDLVGMPDVLRWTDRGHTAFDVKAGSATEGPRHAYKQSYLVQVAHYAHLLELSHQGRSDVAGIIDRNGVETAYDLNLRFGRDRRSGAERHLELLAKARRIRDEQLATRGALAATCNMCDWRAVCREELRDSDDLTQLAGLGRSIRDALAPLARSLDELANLDVTRCDGPAGVGRERLTRFVQRARLWTEPASGPVAFTRLNLPTNPHAIDFDVEADPMRGLVYLHGFWHEVSGGEGRFVHFFAPTLDEAGEREAFAQAIGHFRQHRAAHWFHYSQYERTAYTGLQRRHPSVCTSDEIENIFDPSRCTDLYRVIAQHTDWPLSSYGIKSIARAVGFAWSDTDPSGASSIEWFDTFARTGDPTLRERIISYNRDDVIASARVRKALLELDGTGSIADFRRPAR